jgi:hypothetical protein
MKLLIKESQFNTIISEYYEKDKVYVRKKIIDSLKNAPNYLKKYAKDLPKFHMVNDEGEIYTNDEGEKVIFTKIPEVLYVYLFKGTF